MKEGWEIKKLGDVCDIVGGGTPSKTNRDYYTGNILWATVRDLTGDYIKETECQITDEAVEKSATNIIPKGNVVIATRVGLGKICFIENDTAINQDLKGVIPKRNSRISVDFLFHWFKSIAHLIVENGTGATVQGVKLPFIKELQIPLPPLPEQQRIVAILDEAFAAISKAKANAEKNLQNAKELFESYLQGVFEKKGEGWEEKKLGDVCDIIGGGTPSKSNRDFYSGDILWATVRDMAGDYIKDTECKITREAIKSSATNIVPKGNVIIATRVGLGKICLTENDTAINQDLKGIIPPKNNTISVNFLFHWFKSIAHLIVENGTGATVQGVKIPFIKELLIPFPSIIEQQRIVCRLDNLKAEAQKLEVIYQQKINDLDEFKKSILQKAFTGELTSTKAIAV